MIKILYDNPSEKLSDTIGFECVVSNETAAAFLVLIDDTEYWIPKSQTRSVSIDNGETIIIMSKWIATTKGLL